MPPHRSRRSIRDHRLGHGGRALDGSNEEIIFNRSVYAARTRVCLDQSFKTRFLSEDDKAAAAGSAACRQQRQPE